MPLSHESLENYIQDDRIQFADRYGGVGVGYCGGSARCGTFGDVQIKGVGKNQLHGSKPGAAPEHWHSSGTLNIVEAGREAIWSTICNSVLPHGAVPALAIVLTGTRASASCVIAGREQAPLRALLLRSPALRPAHFLRNVHFDTANPPNVATCSDTLRTSAAINQLAMAFTKAFGLKSSGASSTTTINEGLIGMARRFAAQIAASFAKRTFHGGLCCSNIALDGRFLDFGTMTAVTAYRRRSGAPAPAGPDSWSQHTQLATTLVNLRIHIARYLQCPDLASLIGAKELLEEFATALQHRSEIEFLKLTGIAEAMITDYPPASRSRAFRCMREVFTRGAKTPYVFRGENDESVKHLQPLASTGRFDLNRLLSLAGQCSDADELQIMLSTEVDDAGLANEFRATYTDLMHWYLSRVPEHRRTAVRDDVARQAQRLNADVSFLAREVMDADLASFEHNPDGLGEYINQTIARARSILEDQAPAPAPSGVTNPLVAA